MLSELVRNTSPVLPETKGDFAETMFAISNDYFGLKCILSHYVPVQTIVSPYDANCVTPLLYATADLDFLFGIIVSFDLSFFFCNLHRTFFVNGNIPSL